MSSAYIDDLMPFRTGGPVITTAPPSRAPKPPPDGVTETGVADQLVRIPQAWQSPLP
jgi:hypothetical protein